MTNTVFFRVTHNGMNVKHFDTREEVDAFIQVEISRYEELKPVEVFKQQYGRTDTKGMKQVIVYQYKTLYSEMFMIECL